MGIVNSMTSHVAPSDDTNLSNSLQFGFTDGSLGPLKPTSKSKGKSRENAISEGSLATSSVPPSSPALFSDTEYAIALQIAEIESLATFIEDAEMARKLAAQSGISSVPAAAPTTSDPPVSHSSSKNRVHPMRTRSMSNATAGPSSQPIITTADHSPPYTSTTPTTAQTPNPTTFTEPKLECTSCCETFKSDKGLRSSCMHYYCFHCLHTVVNPLMELLTDGAEEEAAEQLQLELLAVVLDDPLLKMKIEAKWREWSTPASERAPKLASAGREMFNLRVLIVRDAPLLPVSTADSLRTRAIRALRTWRRRGLEFWQRTGVGRSVPNVRRSLKRTEGAVICSVGVVDSLITDGLVCIRPLPPPPLSPLRSEHLSRRSD
ncbi:hypothetical protein AX17_002799 [Amanita inopinata Kibby_2008]|nr:hypothetical protein AX17_002799 [Amanita inopinata Kibby_2008]